MIMNRKIGLQSNKCLIKKLLSHWILLLLFFLITGSAVHSRNLVDSVTVRVNRVPLFVNKINNFAFTIRIVANPGSNKLTIRNVKLSIDKPEFLRNVKVVGLPFVNRWINDSDCGEQYQTLGSEIPDKTVEIEGDLPLKSGENLFFVSLIPAQNVALEEKVTVTVKELKFSDGTTITPESGSGTFRMASVLRAAGQDNVHTYRIPGLAATNMGTLISVYDIRYNNDRDLQEDIDVGMSRSTNGGESWEPMKVIMDMGEYGGLSDSRNGIGDPSVLVDRNTNTIWVAALWVHGNYSGIQNNRFPQQGLDPKPDGHGSQIILVKSEDDGITWSKPINITRQTKSPEWDRFLQGPGCGITLKDGTLVFPAQFLDPSRNKASSSTIIYSIDHGLTWHTAASSVNNGGEAQVAELSDGSIMMNMRSNQKARLVSVSRDLGSTWEVHPSSGTSLQEPGCQASLISANVFLNGKNRKILFFSNTDNPGQRSQMTIKTSLDDGLTWPAEYQLKINESTGYGYSCMTMVDDKTLGIVYEGIRELFFQKIPVKDIIANLQK
jgi:sialidase-1